MIPAAVQARQVSMAMSSFDMNASDAFATQAGTFRAGITPAGFKQDDASTAWAHYAALRVEERAQGMEAKRKKLAFLAMAFRELSCNKNSNFMSLAQFRRVLSFHYLAPDLVDEVFDAMSPDTKGHIHLHQWLDKLPEHVSQRLHTHPDAHKWRANAGFTDQDSIKAKRLRGSPYIY